MTTMTANSSVFFCRIFDDLRIQQCFIMFLRRLWRLWTAPALLEKAPEQQVVCSLHKCRKWLSHAAATRFYEASPGQPLHMQTNCGHHICWQQPLLVQFLGGGNFFGHFLFWKLVFMLCGKLRPGVKELI